MRISLDTNAYANLGKGSESLLSLLETAECIWISAVALGELYAGFRIGSRHEQNVKELVRFLDEPDVNIVEIDHNVADRYGALVKILRENGTPIPTNDIWIAAVALETGSRLVTYDKHFDVVPGLIVVSP